MGTVPFRCVVEAIIDLGSSSWNDRLLEPGGKFVRLQIILGIRNTGPASKYRDWHHYFRCSHRACVYHILYSGHVSNSREVPSVSDGGVEVR